MKNLILIPVLLMFLACGSKESKQINSEENETLVEIPSEERELSIKTDAQFGETFKAEDVKSTSEMLAIYKNLPIGDSLEVQFQSKVEAVCAKKGCWMTLNLAEDQTAHVTFKDYGFFVPKDSQGHKMLVNGIAFIEEIDVETLRHYAEDAGKSKSEIKKITKPELNYRFIGTGAKAVK